LRVICGGAETLGGAVASTFAREARWPNVEDSLDAVSAASGTEPEFVVDA
jgi:hypothetical protein